MDYIRTIAIFIHLIVFAFAITTLYKSDFKILKQRPTNFEIEKMGNEMLTYLLLLTITGLIVVYVDTNFEIERITTSQKLMTKLFCIAILTMNAFFIHLVVFKKLNKQVLTSFDMKLMSASGAISTVSWTFAGFLGIAKPLVKHFSLINFVSLYIFAIVVSVFISLCMSSKIAKNWEKSAK